MTKIITGLKNLKQISESVSLNEVDDIIKQLEEALATTKGYGLSAIQIGILKRVAIIRDKNFYLNLINPKIIKKQQIIRFPKEGCLSLPGIRVNTKRYNHIIINNNFNGTQQTEDYNGLYAICIQHEIDHMNGLNILDRKWKKR